MTAGSPSDAGGATVGDPTVIRVLIVDDQPLIRQGFGMILAAQPDIEVVGEAADGERALLEARRTDPDVILMDIRMPGLDGIEATRRLRCACDDPTSAPPGATGSAPPAGDDAHGGPRVLILTTFGHEEYVAEALGAGAAGFLLKDATPEELVHAVRVVAGGDSLLSPAVTTRLIARVLPSLSTARTAIAGAAALATLTEREREVLLRLARGRSNAEIGEELYISEATVKTHISHVLTKLGLRDRVQAVIAAYELGLLAPGSRETSPGSRETSPGRD